MDIQVTPFNIGQCAEMCVNDVKLICNKKRRTCKSETYLYTGGGYDTESTTILNEENKPVCAFVYHVQIHINGNYFYMRQLDLIVPFFRALSEKIKEYKNAVNQPKLIIWVANLSHEWSFFKRQLALIGITDSFAKEERQPLKIEIDNTIQFRECIGLFGRSLAHIAEQNTETQKLKGDLDYTKIRTSETPLTNEEYQYCKNDVKILDELSYIAFEKFTKQGLKIPMTQTGILRQKCKNAIKNIKFEYNNNLQLMPESEELYYQFRRFLYNGGLSGSSALWVNEILSGVKCADITSDYPAQINHCQFPNGELKEIDPKNVAEYKRYFRIFDVQIGTMKATTPHAIFSRHKILNPNSIENAIFFNGKIRYINNVRIMINDIDLKALLKVYEFEEFKILRCWYFTKKSKAPKFLLECMNDDYKIKCTLKREGKSDTKEYAERKANVNSYYGMTATKLYSEICQFDENAKDLKRNKSDETYSKKREKIWLNPYIAYWCTSYARKILIDLIAKYPELIVQYDTDSIYYLSNKKRSKDLEKDLQKYNLRMKLLNNNMFNDEMFNDLGAWDIDEKPFKRFKCLGAKRYIYETESGKIKPVVAGLPKQAFLDYTKSNNIDPFEFFKNNMTLDRVVSTKLASAYYDGDEKYIKEVDYLGVESIVKVGTYHALYNIDFTMSVNKVLIDLSETIKQSYAYPEKYRGNLNEYFA